MRPNVGRVRPWAVGTMSQLSLILGFEGFPNYEHSYIFTIKMVTMNIRVSHFSELFTKHIAQDICHYLGYTNALSIFLEFSFAVYYLKIESEIYKGNSEKYKGKSNFLFFALKTSF